MRSSLHPEFWIDESAGKNRFGLGDTGLLITKRFPLAEVANLETGFQ
jgi:hypothetical protein